MDFAEALADSKTDGRRNCKVADGLRTLPDGDVRDFEAAIAAGVSQTRVVVALRKLGVDLSYATLNRHVNGVCACSG